MDADRHRSQWRADLWCKCRSKRCCCPLLGQYVCWQSSGGRANQMLQNADYAHNDPMSTIGNMSSGLAGQRMNSWLGSQMPFFNQSRDRTKTQLANQGFIAGAPGQEGSAWNNAMMGLHRDQGLAVGQAA